MPVVLCDVSDLSYEQIAGRHRRADRHGALAHPPRPPHAARRAPRRRGERAMSEPASELGAGDALGVPRRRARRDAERAAVEARLGRVGRVAGRARRGARRARRGARAPDARRARGLLGRACSRTWRDRRGRRRRRRRRAGAASCRSPRRAVARRVAWIAASAAAVAAAVVAVIVVPHRSAGDARTSPRWSRSTARRAPTPATRSACSRRSARWPGSADDAPVASAGDRRAAARSRSSRSRGRSRASARRGRQRRRAAKRARLVEQHARRGRRSYDFTGDADRHLDDVRRRHAARSQVDVTDADGAIEIVAADGDAVDRRGPPHLPPRPPRLDRRRRRARGPATCPSPARRWDLATGGTRTVAGRPATVVVASARRRHARPSGCTSTTTPGCSSAARCSGPTAQVQRSVRFSTVDVGDAPTAPIERPDGRPHRARRSRSTSVPDGYHAPRTLDGYELVDALAPPRRRAALLQRRAVHRVGVRAAGRPRLGRAARAAAPTRERRRHAHAHVPRAERRRRGVGARRRSCTRACPTRRATCSTHMVDRARRRRPQHAPSGRRLRARPVRLELTRDATNRRHAAGVDPGWRRRFGENAGEREMVTGVSTRRRRRMRRRSRSDAPPHTPWSMR